MSEQVNRVLADRPQAFTTAQQAQARANIGAAYTGDLTAYVNYSALSKGADSSITAIGGSAVGMTGVNTKSNLSGIGTTGQPLDLSTSVNLQSGSRSISIDPSHVQLTSQGYSEKFSSNYTVGGFSYTAQERNNTSQSATVDLNTSHLTFEKNTADGHHSAVYSTGGTFINITGTASPSSVDDKTSLWLGNRGVASFRGQSWSTNHTGFRLVGESGNEDSADNPRLELVNPPVGSATVDIPSVMRWNGYSSSKLDASSVAGDGTSVTSINGSAVGGGTVSSNNNITGDGTTGRPIGISSSLNYTLNSISTKLYYSGLYLTGNANRQVEVRGNGISLAHPSATSVLEASSTLIYPGSIYVGGKLSGNSATTNTQQSFSAFEASTDSNHYIGRLEPTALTMTMGWSPSTESAIMTYRTVEVRHRLDSSDTSKDRYVMLYDGRILFGNSGTYAQIRMDDIAKWNDLYTAFTSYTSTHP
jgi:hypothetical protein